MQLYINNKTVDVLDSYLFPNAVRIQVQAICNLQKINSQYFVRQKSFRKIVSYVQEIGLKNTIIKIISRMKEAARNEKYFSVGVGKVIESQSLKFKLGQQVYFIASNHPACAERLVIDENCVLPFDAAEKKFEPDEISWFEHDEMQSEWMPLLAWTRYSGSPFPFVDLKAEKIAELIFKNKKAITIQVDKTPISEIKVSKIKVGKVETKNGVLFGYGNYAKTIILPNLNKNIKLDTIHEIDPAQLIPYKKNMQYDTSPLPRNNKQYDVYFIAGYHHSHADIAIEGLKNNADVVIEKPIITTRDQLEKITHSMRNTAGELYSCFQRRYLHFNDYVFKDFKINQGEPVSYYAVVYEEVLPDLHWYRWPNSRSAIISNGCHWIDHFIFLNKFSPVEFCDVKKTRRGELIVYIELENTAVLSLTLSHLGSARIGMQDYIELRSVNSTIKITNSKHFVSENESRVIRRAKINKFEAFKNMYRMISSNIVDKTAPRLSDSIERLNAVSSVILDLDKMVMDL